MGGLIIVFGITMVIVSSIVIKLLSKYISSIETTIIKLPQEL